ncbi:MAG: serine/threonine-protein kinase, partial [Planctomycetota bacterium]
MADRPTRREEEASTIPPTMIGVTADMPGGLNQNVDSEGVDWDAAEPEPADDDSGFSITAITRFFPRLQLGKNRSSFSSDTANVLRGRLQAYTLITLLVLVLGFLASLGNDTPLRVFRVIVLLIMATAWWRLRRHQDDSLITLRFIETTCVIALVSQVTAMAWLRIDGFATAGDAASTVGATQFLHTLIAVVVLTYGMFIPNSWWRAASISLPIALVPIGVVFALRSFNPDFVTIEQTVDLSKPIPETLVAAVIAITGSQMIQSVRREAFEAKRLGQYTLLDPIGSGGMGDVYRAEHRMLKRPCAIKLVRSDVSDGETAIQRFEAEVQATAELSHWNSIEVYDYGRTDEGTFYYVMELLPGENLEQIVKQHGPMPPGRVVHLLVQVCDALTEAHSRGLIHRDIKPAN